MFWIDSFGIQAYEAVHLYRVGEDGKVVDHNDLTFLAQLWVIEPSSPEYPAPFFQALTGIGNRTG
jgi:hypothetical protein